MVRPLLPTKLVVPALPAGYLARPRLDALWSQWEDKRLVLVTAGAGFGKTSFLAAGGRHTSRPLIWYMLDRTDREPAVFQTHLTRACATTLSGAEAGTSPPIETEDADAWLAELVSALHRSDRGAVVVLDDVQLVGDSPPVFELIDRLLRYLPPRVTLIVASREPVPLTMRKLQAQGSVAVVEARDLRFTEDEVARLFPHRFDGAKLPRHLARDIVECTEGWAAGLEIFFQILPGVAEIQIASTLERFREAGTSWFDYFTEEVVSQQSPELQDFLLRTSVLPRLEPKLCDRLLGRRDSQKRLAELCRRNLFTFPADDCKGIYRYHHLFQEFLQNQLALKFSATEAAQLRLRSGRALKQGKHWVDALDVFSRHVDAQSALELIEDHADALLEAGRYDTVLRALDRLPERTLNRSAEAMYVSGCLHDVKGNWDQAEACFRRGLRLRPTAARRAEMQSRIAQLRMRAGQYESCLRTCRRALREEGAAQSHQVRGRLLGLQGVASCALGRLDQGEQLLNDAVAACRKARHRAGEGRYLFLLAANVLYIRSEYRQAEETAKRALEIFRQLGDRRLICHSMGVLGFVQVAWGRLHTARSLSEDALRRAENLGYRNIEGYCHLTLGQCCLLADDIGAADYHLERARAIGNEIGEVSLQALALVGLAQVAVQEEKRPVARKLSSRAFDLARANDDLWSAGQAAMMQGLAAVGRRQTADQYWREAEAILGKLKAVAPLCRIKLWRLAWGVHDPGAEAHLLTRLLEDTATADLDFLLLEVEPALAAEVLARADDWIDGDLAERAGRLLGRLRTDTETADTETPTQPVEAPATDDETPPPLHVAALGPLEIRVGSRLLTLADWKSGRALRLFQYLLVHRCRWVPREVILETLWPDTDPRKAGNNLRQSVHLLRKTLAGDDDRDADAYVHLRNEAYCLDLGEDGTCDVLDFEAALRRAEAARRQGDGAIVLEGLEAATRLYRGPYLAECPYVEFADEERESLRFSFQHAAERLLDLLADDERWDPMIPLARKAAQQNPYHEAFQDHLLTALLALGHKQEVLSAYARYEKLMTQELDLLPSEDLKRLAEKAAQL